MSNYRKFFSDAFVEEALDFYDKCGNKTRTAYEFGITRPTIDAWIKKREKKAGVVHEAKEVAERFYNSDVRDYEKIKPSALRLFFETRLAKAHICREFKIGRVTLDRWIKEHKYTPAGAGKIEPKKKGIDYRQV